MLMFIQKQTKFDFLVFYVIISYSVQYVIHKLEIKEHICNPQNIETIISEKGSLTFVRVKKINNNKKFVSKTFFSTSTFQRILFSTRFLVLHSKF